MIALFAAPPLLFIVVLPLVALAFVAVAIFDPEFPAAEGATSR